MLAHVASAEGIAAVEHIAGQDGEIEYDAVPACVFTTPEIAAVGLTEEAACERQIAYKTGKFNYLANGKALGQVRVRDGEPFVVGGLFRDNKTNRRVRIPVLGQLPILGELFTYRYNERNKTQVVMLVVPHILEIPDVAVEQEAVLTKR